jgi:hypothetical protein
VGFSLTFLITQRYAVYGMPGADHRLDAAWLVWRSLSVPVGAANERPGHCWLDPSALGNGPLGGRPDAPINQICVLAGQPELAAAGRAQASRKPMARRPLGVTGTNQPGCPG